MMPLFRFAILVIFRAVASQNHDVNSQTPNRGVTEQLRVEATTPFPPDARFEHPPTHLELLCVEKLENLTTDTNKRLQSLENQILEVHSTVNDIRDEVKNVAKDIRVLMGLLSDVEAINRNVSSLINVTTSLVDSSSNVVIDGLQELKDLQTVTSTFCRLNLTLDKRYPKNCREVRESGSTASGIYMIQPDRALKPFEVVCDLETRGGDWTVIQRRFDGSQDFYLGWQDYKNGFGNLRGEFWLGLENIHLLTGFEINELLIEVGDFESQNRSAFYSQFSVGSEMEGYSLKLLGGYSGDAGDSMIYHVESKFTTKDMDQDKSVDNCAQYNGGAWWYKICAHSNLNGKYFDRGLVPEGSRNYVIFWYHFKGYYGSLKHTRMLVRRKM